MTLNLKTILCTVCLSFMTTAAFAASNQHIKLEGIEGESEDCVRLSGVTNTKTQTPQPARGTATSPANTTSATGSAQNNLISKKKTARPRVQQSCK